MSGSDRAWRHVFLLAAVLSAVAVSACGDLPSKPDPREPAPLPAPAAPAWESGRGTAVLRGRVRIAGSPTPVIRPRPTGEGGPPADLPFEPGEIADDGSLPHAFVQVVEGPSLGLSGYPADDLAVDQAGMRFVPHVAGVMRGRSVRFTNSDACVHDVHVAHRALDVWERTQTPGASGVWRPERSAFGVKVLCDMHSWMAMWIHVVPHPFFATTDRASGAYEIRGLYPGRHRFRVWHETWSMEPGFEFEVDLSPGENVHYVTVTGR